MTGPDWNSTRRVSHLGRLWRIFTITCPPPSFGISTLGPRVPLIIISPYARKGYISHAQYEFSSFLKFAEVRFGLPPLTDRDSKASDMLDSFDFNQSQLPTLILKEHRCPMAPLLTWASQQLSGTGWSTNGNRIRDIVHGEQSAVALVPAAKAGATLRQHRRG